MTPEQKQKMVEACGDRRLWPLLTDDPEVNYEIDRALSEALRGKAIVPPWHEAPPDVREIYIEEVVFFKKEPEIRRPPPGLIF